MATLKVQANGNAPSNAKTGDHIVTAGGTYEVLDGSQYQGKSAEELASAGVGYNPSSGLYSKKISDVSTAGVGNTTPQLSLRTTDTARQWANQQNQKVSADLDSAYYQNRQDAYNTYMDSITRQNQQANNVNQAYLDNISKLYDDTYYNNQAAIQRASSRGLVSSGLGNAMQVAALADASKQNAQYRAQRNRDLNNIEAEMNNLTNQYNVNLDTLAKKLRSDKTSALSQNEIAFLQAVMDIEEYNTSAENSMLATQQQQAYEAEQAMLQREFQASEAQKDRDFQLLLQQLGSSGGGYGGGGYGGYRRGGGYSRGGYGGYGSGYGDAAYGDGTLAEYYANIALNGNYGYLTEAEQEAIKANGLTGVTPYAVAAISDAKKRQRGEKPSGSGSSGTTKTTTHGSSSSTYRYVDTNKQSNKTTKTTTTKKQSTKEEKKKKAQTSKAKTKGSRSSLF